MFIMLLSNAQLLEESLKEIDWMQVCKNISRDKKLVEDLYQHSMISFLEVKDNKKMNELRNENRLRYYIGSIIRNQAKNPYSTFNREFKRYTNMIDGNDINENYTDIFNDKMMEMSGSEAGDVVDANLLNYYITSIDNILNGAKYWSGGIYDYYNREIFQMYYKLGDYNMIDGQKRDQGCDKLKSSFRRIEKLTGISYVSLSYTVKETTEYIQSILREMGVL